MEALQSAMYSTCAFCESDLGRNARVEHFPVSHRVAFDAAKGRLWAVCPSCGQWNLAPIEERWEAIEDCERLYRSVRTRVSTDQIGLARVLDSHKPLDLVRIGAPLRPEFAAWRYGAQFIRRQRQVLAQLGGAAGIGAGIPLIATGAVIAGVPLIAAGFALGVFSHVLATTGFRASLPVKLVSTKGDPFSADHLGVIRIGLRDGSEPGSFRLVVELAETEEIRYGWLGRSQNITYRHLDFTGDEAWRGARILLPRINAGGATQRGVRDAVAEIDRAGSAQSYVDVMLRDLKRRGLLYSPINQYPRDLRLALEMVLHEEAERRAMEGDLALLTEAWRRAEETAQIADGLLTPLPNAKRGSPGPERP